MTTTRPHPSTPLSSDAELTERWRARALELDRAAPAELVKLHATVAECAGVEPAELHPAMLLERRGTLTGRPHPMLRDRVGSPRPPRH